jgi:GT2 family glycosyltransferase
MSFLIVAMVSVVTGAGFALSLFVVVLEEVSLLHAATESNKRIIKPNFIFLRKIRIENFMRRQTKNNLLKFFGGMKLLLKSFKTKEAAFFIQPLNSFLVLDSFVLVTAF